MTGPAKLSGQLCGRKESSSMKLMPVVPSAQRETTGVPNSIATKKLPFKYHSRIFAGSHVTAMRATAKKLEHYEKRFGLLCSGIFSTTLRLASFTCSSI